MTLVRIFVPTYQRAPLLARALASLRAQTLTDWVAYVHNDCPHDRGPAAVIAELDDARIHLVTHPSNLGPVASFNRGLSDAVSSEPYFAILEDDNTWYPRFLETLHGCLEKHSAASLVWCNQRIWIESGPGDYHDSGRSVHDELARHRTALTHPASPLKVAWGNFEQATGARMANGAMLLRSRRLQGLTTPTDIPFTGMEAFRERLLPHPMLFLPETLATYTETHVTARSRDGFLWGALQTLLLASFVRHAAWSSEQVTAFWKHLRTQVPAPTNLALHAALSCEGCGALLRGASWGDWARYVKTWVGRPRGAWTCLRARKNHPAWWTALNECTATRFQEMRSMQRRIFPS